MRCRSVGFMALALLAGCERGSGPGGAAGSATASAVPAVATSATPTASAAPAHPHAGTWKGTFEATKGEVTVDEGVPYSTWKKEEGSAAAGAGEIELTVSPNGAVNGEATGALGKLRVIGVLPEEGELAVSLQPADPNAEDAMTGTLVGKAEGDLLKADLRAASRDGNRVRKASTTLKKLR